MPNICKNCAKTESIDYIDVRKTFTYVCPESGCRGQSDYSVVVVERVGVILWVRSKCCHVNQLFRVSVIKCSKSNPCAEIEKTTQFNQTAPTT